MIGYITNNNMDNIELFESIINEIDELIENRVESKSEEFINWKTRTKIILKRIYGEVSDEYKDFNDTYFSPLALGGYNRNDLINFCASVLCSTKAKFRAYIEALKFEEESDNKAMNDKKEKDVKIFISHSSLDKKYAELLVDLLDILHVPENKIVCTSVVGHTIPKGENIYDWIKKQFLEYDLHVILLLSNNYYDSPPSLNEMGAAWALSKKYDFIMLPGFDFKDIKGCIDGRKIGLSLDQIDEKSEEWVEQLKDEIICEFGLSSPDSTTWRRHLRKFFSSVEVYAAEMKNSEKQKNNEVISNANLSRSIDLSDVDNISRAALIMFNYMINDFDNQIELIKDITGTKLVSCNIDFYEGVNNRIISIWEDALEELLRLNLIKEKSDKYGSIVYNITSSGYNLCECSAKRDDIDICNRPEIYL